MYAGLTRRQDKTARRRLERQAKALEKRKLALVVSGTIAEVLVAADSATTTSVIDCQSRGASVGKRERLDRVDLSNEMNDTTASLAQFARAKRRKVAAAKRRKVAAAKRRKVTAAAAAVIADVPESDTPLCAHQPSHDSASVSSDLLLDIGSFGTVPSTCPGTVAASVSARSAGNLTLSPVPGSARHFADQGTECVDLAVADAAFASRGADHEVVRASRTETLQVLQSQPPVVVAANITSGTDTLDSLRDTPLAVFTANAHVSHLNVDKPLDSTAAATLSKAAKRRMRHKKAKAAWIASQTVLAVPATTASVPYYGDTEQQPQQQGPEHASSLLTVTPLAHPMEVNLPLCLSGSSTVMDERELAAQLFSATSDAATVPGSPLNVATDSATTTSSTLSEKPFEFRAGMELRAGAIDSLQGPSVLFQSPLNAEWAATDNAMTTSSIADCFDVCERGRH
eukprot:TRINITY_DN205_c0_g1_i1.p1 TRINITY_DN205_c0_g1~~TRINITY_DN205_c0_g1_i1.p1  ORF type:complete len:456 (+),score=84.60 TRINITY_DN205_c0_g1_i1:1069-2436(+)